MKNKIIYTIALLFSLTACSDFLDRNALTKIDDQDYWKEESHVEFFANDFYPYFFVGYGGTGGEGYTIYTDYTFNDDAVQNGFQTDFITNVPASGVTSTSKTLEWTSTFNGPKWNFFLVRKANVMLDRIETRMKDILTEEQYNHWTGIGRFFRALEYARLVNVFGDVPYYDFELKPTDLDELYKDRTPRNEVMDAVYNDFVYAMNNTRLNAGDQKVNRYVVASFVSRWALVEGTWQRYHENDEERAKKFLNLAIEAADMVINSGKYDIDESFHTLFGSKSAPGKEPILYRTYDAQLAVTHNVASYCTPAESRNMGVTTSLIKAFICNDGDVWENSSVTNADDFSLSEMIKTRDPRFEASFYDKPNYNAKGSLLVTTKFISREGLKYLDTPGAAPEAEYRGKNNLNGYPVMRYGEVLLNWIEAKAEIEDMGGTKVTQADIDKSINKLRDRKLDQVAIDKGVKKTAPMELGNLPEDPNRDADVSTLLWEIRRERRMELAFEHSRIIDLRRWKKLNYMDTSDPKNQDILRGAWVNLPKDLPGELEELGANLFQISDVDGNTLLYDGSNADQMVGFFSTTAIKGRKAFLNQPNVNPYLAPISEAMIKEYESHGYKLSQTKGWPQ